jgi:hypothetical protein
MIRILYRGVEARTTLPVVSCRVHMRELDTLYQRVDPFCDQIV